MYKFFLVCSEDSSLKQMLTTKFGFNVVTHYRSIEDLISNGDILILDTEKTEELDQLESFLKENVKMKCIVVSSKTDYSFLTKLLNLNVLFVEKTDDVEYELTNKINTIVTKLKTNALYYHYQYDEYEQFAIKEFNKLIKCENQDAEKIKDNLERLKVNVKVDYVISIFVKTYDDYKIDRTNFYENVFKANLENVLHGFPCEDGTVIILKANERTNMQELYENLLKVNVLLNNTLKVDVFFGVSLVSQSYSEAYVQSRIALALKIHKDDKINFYTAYNNLSILDDLERVNSTFKTLSLENTISQLKVELKNVYLKKINYNSLLSLLTIVLNQILAKCNNLNILYKDNPMLYSKVLLAGSIEEMFKGLNEVCTKVIKINEEYQINHFEYRLNNILEYIELNYDKDLTLDDIAKQTGLSANYVCALLKKHKNTTFIKYLTKIRVDKAINLIKTNRYKISEVSKLVGYDDPFYFSYCFKKHTGKSPKEYLNRSV